MAIKDSTKINQVITMLAEEAACSMYVYGAHDKSDPGSGRVRLVPYMAPAQVARINAITEAVDTLVKFAAFVDENPDWRFPQSRREAYHATEEYKELAEAVDSPDVLTALEAKFGAPA